MKNNNQFIKYNVVKPCNLKNISKYILNYRKYCDWRHKELIIKAREKIHQHY